MRQMLRCEGYIDNSILYQNWGDPKAKKEWQNKYCQAGGRNCPVYNSINLNKYTPVEDIQNALKIIEALPNAYPDRFIEDAVELCVNLLKSARDIAEWQEGIED